MSKCKVNLSFIAFVLALPKPLFMKPAATRRLLKLLYYQKFLGIFLIVLGVPMLFFASHKGSEFPLMIGLFTLYTSLEKIEDERSVQLKTSSMFIAFIVGYAITVLVSRLHEFDLIPIQLVQINHFVILVFAIAVAIYYPRLYLARNN
jgi:hypothetical protein